MARRLVARKGRRDARRRLLRRAHGQCRLLERGDGRERLHGPQVERVHRGVDLSATPLLSRFAGEKAPRRVIGKAASSDGPAALLAAPAPSPAAGGRLPADMRHAQTRALARKPGVPGWIQAMPFGLVFLLFFVVPLVLRRHRQLLGLQRIRDDPGLHARSYAESFDGCLTQLPDLCTMFKTYVSTAKFCLIVWALTLVHRLHGRLFPRLLRAQRRRRRWCCFWSARSRSGPRTSSA